MHTKSPPPPEVLVKRLARSALARLLTALLSCVASAVIASAQPLDTYTCHTCDPRADQFRSGDYSALSEPIIDPACDCPFPNNVIPRSRLLPNSAWPEDVFRRNTRVFFGSGTEVARAVAQGFTPLLEALRRSSTRHPRWHLHPEELERLLEGLSRLEVNARVVAVGTRSGWTALHHAVHQRKGPVIIQLLLDSGAIVDARADDGSTPLLLAWTLEDFRTLLRAGADVHSRDDQGFTVLHTAARVTDGVTVEALIAAGLDPNARTRGGWTPLHFAKSPEILEALRKAGANLRGHVKITFYSLYG